MKVKPIVLGSVETNVTKFKELYSRDVRAARIYSLTEPVELEEKLLFEETPEKFQIITQVRKYGVSVTGKIYNRPRRVRRVLVNGKKFHYAYGPGKAYPFSFETLLPYEREEIYKKFPFLRFLEENQLQIAFNSVFRYGLYTLKKALRFQYKIPAHKAKEVHNIFSNKQQGKAWRMWLPQMTHLENLNIELLKDFGFFMDCVGMARKMNVKINAAWSKQRLVNEHNEWSRIITDVLYSETNRPLNIKWIYRGIDEVVGGLIKDTKTLALEGMRQKHCVGTYAPKIDSGDCAIYHIEGYTAEIMFNEEKYTLQLNQFKGKFNQDAPVELFKKVSNKLAAYCSIRGVEYKARAVPQAQVQPAGYDFFEHGWDPPF